MPAVTGTGVPGQTVTVTANGVAYCTTTVTSTGTWTCTGTTALTVGMNTIVATSNGATSMGTLVLRCTANGMCSGATPVCNTASGACVAAAVALTNPPANGTAMTTSPTPTLTGTGVPGQMVTVTSSGATLCTATVNATGLWMCNSTTLTPGSKTITATSGGATSMGTLVVQCTMNSQCTSPTPRCLVATGACVECLTNTDCTSALPLCNPTSNVCGAPGDADGDGLNDTLEGTIGTNPNDPDSDGDGVNDFVEVGPDTTAPRNTDGDALIDALDTDDDEDSIPTASELGPNGATSPRNSDTDLIPDYLDSDDDNDTIPTRVEITLDTSNNHDQDMDAIPSYLDQDSDGDTITDQIEAGTTPMTPANSDAVMGPDFLDTDSDNDCLLDSAPQEAGAARTNAALPSANANGNCTSPRPVCDTTVGQCVVCVVSATVPNAGCVGNTSGQRCVNAPVAPMAAQCGCAANPDCANGAVCNTTSRVCEAVAMDAGTDASSGSDAGSEPGAEPRSLTGGGACACRTAGTPARPTHGLVWAIGVAALALARRRRKAA